MYLADKAYIEKLKEHYRRGGLGDVKIKRYLIDVLEAELSPIRARRLEFAKDPQAVMEMLRQGSLQAEKVAAATLDDVKKAMGIQYFLIDLRGLKQDQSSFFLYLNFSQTMINLLILRGASKPNSLSNI